MIKDRWIEEATRVYRRYQSEIVEMYGLCPWAEPARRAGKMRECILLQTDDDIAPSLETMNALVTELSVEVAVMIYPRIALSVTTFDRFVARVRDADAASHALGSIPFAMAAFHPDSRIDRREPERLIPFLRRTPDPTIQIVRSSVLDRVRGNAPQGTSFMSLESLDMNMVAPPLPLRERIARANCATVDGVGIDELEQRLDDIRRDRDAAYARL
jgi:hypothetical protein